MPNNDQWLAFLLVNIIAYLAARNTVLRRERRQEEKDFNDRVERLENERRFYIESQNELERLNKDYWTMIQKQANQIDELTTQINSAKQLHLN